MSEQPPAIERCHADTAAAIAEVDRLREKIRSWRDIDKHALALSPAAKQLALVLDSVSAATSIAEYEKASRNAQNAQKHQHGFGRYAAWLGFVATGVSGLMLYLQWAQGTVGSLSLQILHFICLGLALGSTFYLRMRRPSDEWGNARMRSEALRLDHFQKILDYGRKLPKPLQHELMPIPLPQA